MIAIDPLTEFLANLSPVDVEPERFTGKAHRELLVTHEQSRIEFWRAASLTVPHEPKHREPREPRVDATYKRNPARFAALVEQRRSNS